MAAGIPCHKVILVGEYGVGKSSLFRRFVDNSFEPDPIQLSKAGLDNFSKTMKIEEQVIQVGPQHNLSFVHLLAHCIGMVMQLIITH